KWSSDASPATTISRAAAPSWKSASRSSRGHDPTQLELTLDARAGRGHHCFYGHRAGEMPPVAEPPLRQGTAPFVKAVGARRDSRCFSASGSTLPRGPAEKERPVECVSVKWRRAVRACWGGTVPPDRRYGAPVRPRTRS